MSSTFNDHGPPPSAIRGNNPQRPEILRRAEPESRLLQILLEFRRKRRCWFASGPLSFGEIEVHRLLRGGLRVEPENIPEESQPRSSYRVLDRLGSGGAVGG